MVRVWTIFTPFCIWVCWHILAKYVAIQTFCYKAHIFVNIRSVFFSIIKNALFGEGTYLSQEPSLSLHYSPANKTWSKSVIGQRMSCLLVTETINDPNHVKTGINGKY